MRTILTILAILYAGAIQAQTLQTVPSTPDIAVTATATMEVTFNHIQGPARFVAIKNDCSDTLYFDLRRAPDGNTNNYPLRLGSGESFNIHMNIYTVGASPAAGNSACTFTLILGE